MNRLHKGFRQHLRKGSGVIKPQAISGFPEYTPDVQLAAQTMLDGIRRQFELYGFVPIETPVIERLEVLLAKGGDTDKEMYLLSRMDPQEDAAEPKLGMHYDLTVPFARYVAQHFGSLVFPFKRYQMQPCWRGERPQEGRFRQFLQCDIDVVAVDNLPLAFDAEIPLVAYEVLAAMNVGNFAFRLSNRKIMVGYLEGLGFEGAAIQGVTRTLDKLEKIGRAKVLAMLEEQGVAAEVAPRCLEIATICTTDLSFADQVRGLGVSNERLEKGLEELTAVMKPLLAAHSGGFMADLSVTRGLDYYTGTVYEIRWTDFPKLGSIGAGGRYDDLASNYTRQKLPGVGLSLGFSRIFAKLVAEGRLPAGPKCPTKVLVTWLGETNEAALAAARGLRAKGIPTEVFHEPAKLTKQLNYANKKAIPFVYFDTDGEMKNMVSGEQVKVTVADWNLPA